MKPLHRRRRRSCCPVLEKLEDRNLLSVVPTEELSEGNATAWIAFAQDGATTSVSDDTTKVVTGNQSLRFETQSGFDTGIRLASGDDSWDVSGFQQLAFWTFAVNDTPIGFQGNQPVLVLQGPGGSIRYTPTSFTMLNHGWQKHHVSLAGDDSWQREVNGTPDLSNITSLEIHQDTWDFGFTVYFDGIQFSTRAVTEPPPDGPAPPPGVTEDVVHPRILLFVFDPIMEVHDGQRLHEVYGWQDPVQLTNDAIADLRQSSHGLYQPQIVQTLITDVHPYFRDGFQHTDQSFDIAWANRDFHQAEFDYARFIQENNLVARADQGDIDEVWIYGPPISGMYESVMAGQDAFWINGPTQPAGQRAFAIMGLNYERGVGEAIHSFGHRVEGTLDHIYEGLNGDPNNTWRRFTRINRDAPGQGGVGNVHFPVNALKDYDYDNASDVMSNADDWYNYPNFSGQARTLDSTAWTPQHQDPQREYLNWWYDHMPHFGGRGPDNRLMNWWRYIADLDAFKSANRDLHGSDASGKVWLTGVNPGDTVQSTVALGASALVDGVIGRMDLYVDGAYHSSDTIGPFTFNWNTTNLGAGGHTLEVRGYEVQNGTEIRSEPITVNIQATDFGHPPTDIELSANSVAENAAGAKIGIVTASDPDAGDSHTFVVTDIRFEIVDGQLQLKAGSSLDYEFAPSINLDVIARDTGGLEFKKSFIINVTDVNDPPTTISLALDSLQENISGAVIGTVSAIDPDDGQTHSFTTADLRLEIVGTTLKLKVDAYFVGASASVEVTATDSGVPPQATTQTVVINVIPNPRPWQNSTQRFDTNADGSVVSLDILRVINQLNAPTILGPNGDLPDARAANSTLPYYDVNGDSFCTPNDVLQIVNFLLRDAEAESSGDRGLPQFILPFLQATPPVSPSELAVRVRPPTATAAEPAREPTTNWFGQDDGNWSNLPGISCDITCHRSTNDRGEQPSAEAELSDDLESILGEITEDVLESRLTGVAPEVSPWTG